MSKKTATTTKPAQQAPQPPAKSAPSKPTKPVTQATVSKGNFDASPWTKLGFPEEVVVEIKTAFDLFDTDQGGSIDTKGNFYH